MQGKTRHTYTFIDDNGKFVNPSTENKATILIQDKRNIVYCIDLGRQGESFLNVRPSQLALSLVS